MHGVHPLCVHLFVLQLLKIPIRCPLKHYSTDYMCPFENFSLLLQKNSTHCILVIAMGTAVANEEMSSISKTHNVSAHTFAGQHCCTHVQLRCLAA
jgi:hypothetical protein